MQWSLHTIFPAKKQSGSSPFVLKEHVDVIHGHRRGSDADYTSSAYETGVVAMVFPGQGKSSNA